VVALGLNIVLLVNLALVNLARSASVWAVVLQRRRPVAALERWETGYLPVFPVWAAVVAVLVPPLFAFAWVWGGAPSSARAWVGPLGAHTRDRFLNLGRPALHHVPLPSRSMRAIVGPSAARRTVVKGVAAMGAPQLTSEEPSGHPRERLLALTAAALALVMGIVAGVTIAVGGEPPASRDEDAKNAGGVAAAAAAPEHDPLVVDRSTIGGLRLGLEQLLGYDAVVTARLVEARVRDDDDVARVIETVLQHNTSDLAGLVGSIYGADAGSTLQRLWESRTAAAGEYATAVADGDTAEVPSAREGLRESSQEVAEFLGATSSGAVPADVLASGQWVDHITALVDAYAAGRYAEGLALVHDTHELAFSVARGLAAG
jgi:hypothetical protein